MAVPELQRQRDALANEYRELDTAIQAANWAVDLVDTAIIRQLAAVPSGLNTFTLGTARPLREIRAQLSATFERELTLYETDLVVRTGTFSAAGRGQR